MKQRDKAVPGRKRSLNGLFLAAFHFSAIVMFMCAETHAQNGPGGGLSFNGTGNYVSVPDFGMIAPTNEITVEFWARVDEENQSIANAPFGLQPNNNSNRLGAHLFSDGVSQPDWDFGNTSGGGRLSFPPTPNLGGKWVHWAFVSSQSGNYMRVYLNGQWNRGKSGRSPFLRGSYELRIGGIPGDYFNGAIDEFRVWNRARSIEEIETNRTRSLTGGEDGLLLYYRFDEIDGLVASNSAVITGGAYDGTLVNAPSRITSRAVVDALFSKQLVGPTPDGELNGRSGFASWADADNDGDLDILQGSNLRFQNEDGTFTFPNANGLNGGNFSHPWGDYDNDGDLDVLQGGADISRNLGDGTFTNVNIGLPEFNACEWGDYDNDGYLDILLSGSGVTEVWRNNGGQTFSNVNAGLPGLRSENSRPNSSITWGDYDNDGWLDILISGNNYLTMQSSIAQVWRNNRNGTFTDIDAELPGVSWGQVAWGDYDNDGRLDILLAGEDICQIWRNNENGTFTDINAGLPGIIEGSAAWGDYNNNGYLDILLSGSDVTEVWRNNGNGTFTDIDAGLPAIRFGSAAWGDYDNDGDLDIIVTGNRSSSTEVITELWRNNIGVSNTPPERPAGLTDTVLGQDITLSWQTASDAQTPASGLTYNLRVGTTPGGSEVFSPEAGTNGFRRLPAPGNVRHGTTAELKNLPFGTYYWSVQALDTAFVGSSFSPEQRFELFLPDVATLEATGVEATSATLNGIINPRGRETFGWFEYGLTTKYDNTTPTVILGNATNALPFDATPSLYPTMTYYYRAVASNIVGEVKGNNSTLILPGPSQVAHVLSPLSDLGCAQGGFSGIGFTVSPADLEVTVRANNPVLLPEGSMALSGSGSSRQLGLSPNPIHSGSAQITVTASDGTRSTSRTFTLTVVPDAIDSRHYMEFTSSYSPSPEVLIFSLESVGADFTDLSVEYTSELSPTNSWIPATNVTSLGANEYEVNTGPGQAEAGFYRVRGIQLFNAELDTPDITADEGTAAGAVIVFNGTYDGTVNYSWTDEDGVTQTNSLQVHGSTAVIPIPVNEDATIGRLSYLTVRLEDGTGYGLTGTLESRVTIEENDAVWVGVLDTPNGLLSFELTLLRENGNLMGEIKSKESGFFPTNVLTYVSYTTNAFTAFAKDIPIPKLTGTPMFDKRSYMTLGLTAIDGPGESNVRPKQIQGTATLFSTIPGRTQLDTETAGTFALYRLPTAPSTNEVPLYPVP